MSRISNFLGQPKDIDIESNIDGKKVSEKFKIHPLTGKHLHLFMSMGENATAKDKEETAFQIVYESLKPSEPDLTLEEVSNLPIGIINKLLLVCMDPTLYRRISPDYTSFARYRRPPIRDHMGLLRLVRSVP